MPRRQGRYISKVPLSRIACISSDASQDLWIEQALAKDLFNRGELAIDVTNSRTHERVYAFPNVFSTSMLVQMENTQTLRYKFIRDYNAKTRYEM